MISLLQEDGRDDSATFTADSFPDAADIGDVALGEAGDGVGHLVGVPVSKGIFRSTFFQYKTGIILEGFADGLNQSGESLLQSLSGFSSEATAQFFLQHADEHFAELLTFQNDRNNHSMNYKK